MQYVGTVLNHELREKLRQELTVDPAMVHILDNRGLTPEQITSELIVRVRNVVERLAPKTGDADGTGLGWTGSNRERCHASEG